MPRVANIPSEVAISSQQRDEAEEELREQQKPIDYNTLEYPIEILVKKYTDGLDDDTNELFIPDYQREMAWDNARQSKFIESMLLGLPIPYIFVADISDEENDARLEIIDGTQRIRTLAGFINNDLKLESLEKLKKFNNFRFEDLAQPRQRRFKRTTIRMIQLTEKADEDIRRDMFERINNGSVELNDMEKRRGIYDGPFLEFIEQLSESDKFRKLCPFSEPLIRRREPQEFVLRFFAYLHEYKKFNRKIDDFLNDYLRRNNNSNFDRQSMQAEFERMLDFVEKYFPDRFLKSQKHTTVTRIWFESISVGAILALRENGNLEPSSMSWLQSPEFKKYTAAREGTTQSTVTRRIEYVRDRLLDR
jgi:uncharacterized protein with ParB-like and HNH nuclease domain